MICLCTPDELALEMWEYIGGDIEIANKMILEIRQNTEPVWGGKNMWDPPEAEPIMRRVLQPTIILEHWGTGRFWQCMGTTHCLTETIVDLRKWATIANKLHRYQKEIPYAARPC